MKPTKPTILFVHPDLRGGGAEKVLVNLLNTMDTSKYDITLLTYFEEGVNRKNLNPDIKQEFIFKKVFRGWSVVQKLFTPKQLYQLFIKKEYNVVIAYLEGVPTRMVSGCPFKNTKLISWLHIDLKNFGIEKVFRSKNEMEKCYLRLDEVVAVSKRSLASLFEEVEFPKEKGRVIHNVVDTREIIKKSKEPVTDIVFDEHTINLCSVGRLNRQKGYQRLIEVMSELTKTYKNIHLYIIGKGELQQELEMLIKHHKMENHVSLLGFQSNPLKYVRNADLFVCSSFEEGYSTAVTESIILGTPVLTTACAGMDELLDNGEVGMIVENSKKGLLNGFEAILKNEELLKSYKEKTLAKSSKIVHNNNGLLVEALIEEQLHQLETSYA
ncbi:glycosyltransferase [Galbibacter sp. BG1]|uniref:glycosyltransferase n=1 Tax=Galbibacter sp. BG1 TaxID=1170699 RepID=UPI0015BBE663|nr:glycosyltransferase [Galbibacter sp. BG1]QLE02797.1 glycosyltransferase [Galbibacter sp. BG1]